MAAQRAKLSIGKSGFGAFDVAAVPKPHELGFWIDAGRGPNGSDAMPEMIELPRHIDFATTVEHVSRHYQGAAADLLFQPAHKLRPQGVAVFVVQRKGNQLPGLVVEDLDLVG